MWTILKICHKISQIPSITAFDEDGGENRPIVLGDIAEQYLRKFASVSSADKIFDKKIRMVNYQGSLKKGNQNCYIVIDKEYVGTPGLWELIVLKEPDSEIQTDEDYDNYAEIMHKTSAIRRNYDENDHKPKANKSQKWKQILRQILDEKDLYAKKLFNTFGNTE